MSHKKFVWKADGTQVPFSRARVETSLRRAGASAGLAKDIALNVEQKIRAATTTADIYRWAYAMLKKRNAAGTAARYTLKKAVMALGPSGFPFERFVGEILQELGFRTEVSVMLDGRCVRHEVDVVAHKGQEHWLVECKFHTVSGITTNVKVPLYIHSRFVDIEENMKDFGDVHLKHEHVVVTNTHFSKDAIAYGTCKGMKLIGWRYPKDGGLEAMIEQAGLHPITCLGSLKEAEKTLLLEKNIVLCKDLVQHLDTLSTIGIREGRIAAITKEVEDICQNGHTHR